MSEEEPHSGQQNAGRTASQSDLTVVMHHRKIDSPGTNRSSAVDDGNAPPSGPGETVSFAADVQRKMWAMLFLGSATYGLWDVDFVETLLSHPRIDRFIIFAFYLRIISFHTIYLLQACL
jgi:hypothetical protein